MGITEKGFEISNRDFSANSDNQIALLLQMHAIPVKDGGVRIILATFPVTAWASGIEHSGCVVN